MKLNRAKLFSLLNLHFAGLAILLLPGAPRAQQAKSNCNKPGFRTAPRNTK